MDNVELFQDPKISVSSSNVKTGDELNITCKVVVRKSGTEPAYKILDHNGNVISERSQITINPVQSTNIGSYKCVFSANGVDKESNTATVIGM